MKKKYGNEFGILTAVLFSALLFTGCGASKDAASATAIMEMETASTQSYSVAESGTGSYYQYDTEGAEMAVEESDMQNSEDVAVSDSRKLIRTVDMSVETKEFDELMTALETQAEQLGGYIERLDTYNGSAYSGYRGSRDASLTLRIPQSKLDDFLESVSDICNVIHRSDSVEDVTLTYVDMESHRDALKTEQGRLLELLERAESMEDILVIEERLTDIRYQLDSMESKLRVIDNQVEYSTVYLSVEEVRELTPVEEQTTAERITEGFAESLKDIGDGAMELFVWFVINLPHLVIRAAVIVVIVLIVRKQHRRRKAKKEAAKSEKDAKSASAG